MLKAGTRLRPFIKWPGGKGKELNHILPNFPDSYNKYYEPFVGGGAVYFSVEPEKEKIINDKSTELINLYRVAQKQDNGFIESIQSLNRDWELIERVVENHSNVLVSIYFDYASGNYSEIKIEDIIAEFTIKRLTEFNGILSDGSDINLDNFTNEIKRNLIRKFQRMKQLEVEKEKISREDIVKNIESAFKAAFYYHFRYLYNNSEVYKLADGFRLAIFYFIREFCYSSMFRYNSKGEFNVPYGGVSYNHKSLSSKIKYLTDSELLKKHLGKTQMYSLDFEDFLNKVKPSYNDFIFLDPPYDSEFSTYTKNCFDRDDQERLANYLYITPAKILLVIKNTKLISRLYDNDTFNICSFNKKYLVSFQNRNEKCAEHLLIRNYSII